MEKTAMRILKKTLKWTAIGLAGLVATLTLAVVVLERRTYDTALPAIQASGDPAVIARGKYLAHGAAHCVDCHGDPARRADVEAGREIPLSGGFEFKLPLGIIRPANITSDRETGIGAVSDGQLARALRHGVGSNGRALAPFMPFADLSDSDLTAIISYLRTLPPVRNPVTRHSLNPLGHAVMALVIKPKGPSAPPPAQMTAAPTAEYGRYLVHSVGNCVGCHTRMDMRTGALIGPPLAGGAEHLSHSKPGTKFVTPNLTPDPRTGRIANWTEEVFVARFKMARGAEGSPMPWPAFGRMNDDDLRAIYRYLRTVPAVENDTGESVRAVVASAH
jgi:mono/diheme cytochrome c family protein